MASTKEYSPAAELREVLAERGLSIVKAAQLLGLHRDTLQRWLFKNQVPLYQLERLRTIETALPSYRGDFEIRLAKLNMTLAKFCDLTGVTEAEVKVWKDRDWVPKWTVVILKQQLTLKDLMKERSAAAAPKPAAIPVVDSAAPLPLNGVAESDVRGSW